MARGDRDLRKEQFWRGVLRQWQQSKQTIRDFCVENGVSEPNFYAWRRIIAERDQNAVAARRHEAQTDDLPAFVPLAVALPAPSPILEVVAGSGHLVRVPPDFDSATLRRLLAVLEEATPC